MTTTFLTRNSVLIIYGIPLLLLWVCIALGLSSVSSTYPELAIGITYDLTISVPLIYLFLIRKTEISKLTVIPFFTGGMIIASYLLPIEQQYHLSSIKFWLFPALEVVGLGYIGWLTYRTVKTFKAEKGKDPDRYKVIRIILANFVNELVSKNMLVNGFRIQTRGKRLNLTWLSDMLAFEASALYYAFLSWKRIERPNNTFTYHRNSGNIALFGAAILIVAAETFVLHFILAEWNEVLAWAVTIPSLYMLLQLFAHIKAVYQRPIEITSNKLIVRYGLLGDTEINLDNILSVECCSTFPEGVNDIKRVSLLGELEQFNTIIKMKKIETFIGFYGMKSKYKTLVLYVDENHRFKKLIERYESN